jgi:hypothetical protein
MKRILTDFAIGFIAGFVTAAIFFGIVAGAVHYRNKGKERLEYVELQQEIEALREDVINLTADELFELSGVRGAADGAAEEFIRKRDEALQAFWQRRNARLRDQQTD